MSGDRSESFLVANHVHRGYEETKGLEGLHRNPTVLETADQCGDRGRGPWECRARGSPPAKGQMPPSQEKTVYRVASLNYIKGTCIGRGQSETALAIVLHT